MKIGNWELGIGNWELGVASQRHTAKKSKPLSLVGVLMIPIQMRMWD
jgi:hypothetical protein